MLLPGIGSLPPWRLGYRVLLSEPGEEPRVRRFGHPLLLPGHALPLEPQRGHCDRRLGPRLSPTLPAAGASGSGTGTAQGPGMAGSRLETVGSVFTRCVLGAGGVPRARGRLSLLLPFLGGSDPGQASLVLCPASEKLCLAASPLEFLSSHVQDRTFPLSKWKVK